MKKWKTFGCSELKHLFTYSLFASSKLWKKGGNKTKKWKTFSWSELKHLFTYSPIHLFTYSPIHCLPTIRWFRRLEPKRHTNHHVHQNWAYATKTKRPTASPKLCWHAVTLICWYATNYPVKLQRSFGTCSVVLEIMQRMHSFSLVGVKTPIHLFTFLDKYWKKRRRNSIWCFPVDIHPILT